MLTDVLASGNAFTEAAKVVQIQGVCALPLNADVRDRTAVDELSSAKIERSGRIDQHINVAGVDLFPGPRMSVSDVDSDRMESISVRGHA